MATVLLVEDDELLRELLAHQLEAEGFDVLQAEDGQNAQSITADFDAVLCDLVMPNMDGIDFVRWLKNRRPEANVVILSGEDRPDIKESLEALGVNDFFHKPLSIQPLDTLAQRLRSLTNG